MHGRPDRRDRSARPVLEAVVAVLAWSAVYLGASSGPAAAAGWPVGVAAANSGLAQAQPPPPAPTGATATCVGLLSGQITVSWSAVTHAISYTIYDSTTAATGPYTVLATGVTSSPWTSPVLTTNAYWFEVSATVGTQWSGPLSAATAGRLILVSLACT